MSDREQGLTTASLAGLEQEDRPEATRDPHERGSERPAPLLSGDDAGTFGQRWESIQIGFVDEPRQSVEHADELVAELMQHLAQTFARERDGLEAQWSRGEDVSTEDLRLALQRYRSFFERLLSV